MERQLKYQLRVYLDGAIAAALRGDPGLLALAPLRDVLKKRGAAMKCQFDAFADYVAEAERNGPEGYHLYKWTKAVIENPAKKQKYLKCFTIYAGGEEVYEKEIADALEADLKPLVERGLIAQLTRQDTDPANNPQPPAHLR